MTARLQRSKSGHRTSIGTALYHFSQGIAETSRRRAGPSTPRRNGFADDGAAKKNVQLAAVDSTGLEATSASGYFVKRRSCDENPRKTVVYHRYPKLAVVCKTFHQFIVAFEIRRGPKPDVDQFKDLVRQARRGADLKVLVADAGYDSESNHEFARQTIGACTIIPAKHGRSTAKPARGTYRHQMQTRFDAGNYRSRVQVETTISMLKRRQGNHLRGTTYWSQCHDLRLMVPTHNIMMP